MKIVEKKVWPHRFAEILSGRKKFELRKNDFEVADGDILHLREYDPLIDSYTGREVKVEVTLVLSSSKGSFPFFNPWDNLDQFQIIGFDNFRYVVKND